MVMIRRPGGRPKIQNSAMLEVGRRVRIAGLKSRPDLNGTIAVVLKPENEEEAEALRQSGRIKVTGMPKTMSIQLANLTPIDERSERTDWTCRDFVDRKKSKVTSMAIEDIIQNSNLRDCSKCDEFVDTLCDILANGTSIPRHRFYEHVSKEGILNHTAKHCIYFCYFDQIGHRLVFETKDGKARLFQSFIKASITMSALQANRHSMASEGPCQVNCGFTASEWASPRGSPGWMPSVAAAHRKWGGSRELSRGQLDELLTLLWSQQAAISEVASALQGDLPPDLLRAEQEFWDAAAGTRAAHASGTPGLPRVGPLANPLAEWARQPLSDPSAVSTAPAPGGGVEVFSNGPSPGPPSGCARRPGRCGRCGRASWT